LQFQHVKKNNIFSSFGNWLFLHEKRHKKGVKMHLLYHFDTNIFLIEGQTGAKIIQQKNI